ncbi:HAD family hydrolase [Micromonospora zamorensis]|uniref:HAD family hydrolase n=1 Tax=Micromonospora zamorensis TaxID=709883 RepID=UPI0033AC1E8E
MINAIFFDVGGTILDESHEFAAWADWLGVPRHTFSAVFGAVIARGLDYQETFRAFRPDFDLAVELERRAAAGQPESFGEEDLYPDARPCLASLREQGLVVGLAGNQPAHAESTLRALDLPVDLIGTSHGWGVAKPSPAFFERVLREGGGDASSILYVGDRPDNDARPAQEAGMKTCLIRRSPWGHILDIPAVSQRCLFRIDSLDELPSLVAKHNAAGG